MSFDLLLSIFFFSEDSEDDAGEPGNVRLSLWPYVTVLRKFYFDDTSSLYQKQFDIVYLHGYTKQCVDESYSEKMPIGKTFSFETLFYNHKRSHSFVFNKLKGNIYFKLNPE